MDPGLTAEQQALQVLADAERAKRNVSHKGSGTRFSGAPLWRFALRRDEQKRQQEESQQQDGPPEGFVMQRDGWYMHPIQRTYWQSGTRKYFTIDETTKQYLELKPEDMCDQELSLKADASSISRQEGVREDRHVKVIDLRKAAQLLKMPIDHFARPCALFAVYSGHRPALGSSHGTSNATGSDGIGSDSVVAPAALVGSEPPPTCAEFCARNLHLKLLSRLSSFKGPWADSQVIETIRASFREVDADFIARPGGAADGCSAAVVLVTGRRLFMSCLGDVASLVGVEAASSSLTLLRPSPRHSPGEPSELQRLRQAGGAVFQDPTGRTLIKRIVQPSAQEIAPSESVLHVSRAFGDRSFKKELQTDSKNPLVLAIPDVRVLTLDRSHTCVLLACDGVLDHVPAPDIADVLRRRSGKPRMASGSLLQGAQATGAPGSLTALCVYLDWNAGGDTPAPAKRQKASDSRPVVQATTQVRCRQILVRHKACKEPVDIVRGKPVVRTLAEAEGLLREAMEAIENSPEKSVFTQRCKSVSECSTSLKGGEMAGDLGWISRGKGLHPAVEVAAFSLPVGHISDIVESDEGVHLLWRIA